MNQPWHYLCSVCEKALDWRELVWRCPDCGSPVTVSPAAKLARGDIAGQEQSLWRYGPWLAFQGPRAVTLGEGWTPIIEGKLFGHRILWKCEFISASGSFKDRGIALMLNFLLSRGVMSVSEDSSGNAGASLATFSAAASIPCRVYVPESASAGKVDQIRATGAEVITIPGARQGVADAAMLDVSGAYYASHNWHPMFIEGIKTVGFEIWEQLGDAPDVIIAPLGGGSNLIGCRQAFDELQRSGLTRRTPRLIGVQSRACEPLAKAFREGQADFMQIDPQPTLAEGIAVSRPVRSREALAAVDQTGGSIVSVSEADIIDAHSALARCGLYVEPTSATAAAGLKHLLEDGTIGATESVVVILTGSGLKTGALPS